MTIEKIIQQLGYKYKEVRVYLTALCLGESNLADIATKAKMPRTSVHVITEKLRREGLLNYYSTRVRKYWVATSPEILVARLQEKTKSLQSILPELKNLQNSPTSAKPNVTMYSGPKEIKLIFDDIIAAKHNICGIAAWKDLTHILGIDFMQEFFTTQIAHFINIRLITPENEQTLKLQSTDSGHMRETRFISNNAPLNTAQFFYGKKVAIISLNENFPTGVLIEDPDVHTTMEIMFEKIWREAA